MNKLDSLQNMQEFFEKYCKENSSWLWPSLDLTKGGEYNAYLDERTGLAYCWFINGASQMQREMMK